ncbi:hypothetical protein [Staphylococcus simulans]|uniref:hypothetical protein n=1 Tax=Staphylococcus simulans TaxID=1286 RepID=UPI003F8234C4
MKLHHLMTGLLAFAVLLAGCGHKEDTHKQADNQKEQSTESKSQDTTSNDQNQTNKDDNTKQEKKVVVKEEKTETHTKETTKEKSNTDHQKSESDKQTSEKADTSSQNNNEPSLEFKGKAKDPAQIFPGAEAAVDRKHVAMMLMDGKLNKKFVTAGDLDRKSYTTVDGEEKHFANFILFSSGWVPQLKNSPNGMYYYYLIPQKESEKRILVGISNDEIVIGTSNISDQDGMAQNFDLDYNGFTQQADTQIFKVKDLEKKNLNQAKLDALAKHVYQVTPHTLQYVPEN